MIPSARTALPSSPLPRPRPAALGRAWAGHRPPRAGCTRSRRPRPAALGRAWAAALALLLAAALWPAGASAKEQKVIRYPFEQVWPAAIRFLRVDEGCEILERDADAGYVLFELRDDGERFRGSLEIVRVRVADRDGLRLLVGIEDRPAYMEQGLLDRFERKLRVELGPPPRPTPKPKPAPKPETDPEPKRAL